MVREITISELAQQAGAKTRTIRKARQRLGLGRQVSTRLWLLSPRDCDRIRKSLVGRWPEK